MPFFRLLVFMFLLMTASIKPVLADSVFPNTYETEHFQIYYSDNLEVAAPGTLEFVSETVEETWDMIIDSMEYPVPYEGLMTFYLDDAEAYLPDGAIGVAGYLDNDTDLAMAVNPNMSEELIQVTIAHEFFHMVQYGMTDSYLDLYLAESTAVWMEEQVYDDVDDYIVSYFSEYFNYPDYSIFGSNPPTSLYEYSLAIWPIYLSEQFGANLIQDLWENYGASDLSYADPVKVFYSYNDVISEYGEELNSVFHDFTLSNLDPSEFYSEGETYEEVASVYLMELVANGTYYEMDEMMAPALYSTNYLFFTSEQMEDSFSFHIKKPEGVRFWVTLIPYREGGPVFEEAVDQELSYDEVMEEALVLSSDETFESVYVIVSALDKNFDALESEIYPFDQSYPYSYAAQFANSLELPNLAFDLEVSSYGEEWVQLDWDSLGDSNVKGYEVIYGEVGSTEESSISIDKPYHTGTTIYDLELGQEYYFQVQAIDASGDPYLEASEPVYATPTAWIFTDISFSHSQYEAISFVKDLGIFEGYPDGSFGADRVLLRAELLKVLMESMGITPDVALYNNCFPDVGEEWFAPYVCYAKEQGHVQGDPSDGLFHPEREVNKVEALKMVLEVFGIADYYGVSEGDAVSYEMPYPDVSADEWYSAYIDLAWSLGALVEEQGDDFNPDDGRERGDTATQIMLIYDYIQAPPPSLELIDTNIELPSEVNSGEEFEITVTLTNQDTINRYFYSLDIGKEFLEAVVIDCFAADFECIADDYEYTYGDYEYLAFDYLWYLAPGESLTIVLPAYAIEPGEYRFPFDICMDEGGNNCIETIQTMTVEPCSAEEGECPISGDHVSIENLVAEGYRFEELSEGEMEENEENLLYLLAFFYEEDIVFEELYWTFEIEEDVPSLVAQFEVVKESLASLEDYMFSASFDPDQALMVSKYASFQEAFLLYVETVELFLSDLEEDFEAALTYENFEAVESAGVNQVEAFNELWEQLEE